MDAEVIVEREIERKKLCIEKKEEVNDLKV